MSGLVGDDQTLDGTWGTAVEVTDSATGAAYKRLKTSVMSGITLARSSGSNDSTLPLPDSIVSAVFAVALLTTTCVDGSYVCRLAIRCAG